MKFRVLSTTVLFLFVTAVFAEVVVDEKVVPTSEVEKKKYVFVKRDINGQPIVTKTTKSVLVVGGGMAGLAAAVTAIDNGCNVTLLESQNYIGGKLYSEELGGIQSNLGAQYIYNNMHPIIDYYIGDIRKKTLNDLKTAYIKNGNYHNLNLLFLAKLLIGLNAIAGDYSSSIGTKEFYFDKDPQNTIWNTLENMGTDTYLYNYQSLNQDVADYIAAGLAGEAGGDVSTLAGIVPVGWYGNVDQDVRYLLKDGNESLAKAIKDDLIFKGATVLTNKVVTNVIINGYSVDVTCLDSSTYSADYAVVATPAYIAKNIVSGLSTAKQTALNAVDYASIAIVSLYVKQFPLGKNLHGVLYMDEDINGWLSQTGRIFDIGTSDRYFLQATNVVNAIVTDSTLLAMNDANLVDAVGEELEICAGILFNHENDVIDSIVNRYDNGIAKLPLQFLTNYQADLQASVSDKIFFAGDYMYSPDLAGAAWAGARAADEILAQLH